MPSPSFSGAATATRLRRNAVREPELSKTGPLAPVAKKAGFRKGDIIVEIVGSTAPLSEIDLLAKSLREKRSGEKVPVVVPREGKRVALEMPVQ